MASVTSIDIELVSGGFGDERDLMAFWIIHTHIDAVTDSNVKDPGFERIRPSGRQLDAEKLSHFSGKEAIGDLKKTSPSLDVLKTRKRSAANLEDRFAKRCKFFARGRCTKGNSCRFFHTKQPVTSHETSKIPHDKGLEEKSLLDCSSQSGENLRIRGGEDSLHPNSHLGYISKSPAFPSSITGYYWKNHLSQDTWYSSDYTTTDDWEPSVPFNPTFMLSQMVRYHKSVLYDGICNSIYQSDVGDGSFPVLIKHMQANADPASTGSNKVKIFGHSDMLPEKDLPRHGKAVAHQENMNTSSNEDKHLESEIDVDNKSVNTKLVVLKNFHVALVEFVEELLRPTWNLGLLSKVAYKKIVKKTVNIVENSLHPNQIPNTAKSTEEYFNLSVTKLSNTIENVDNHITEILDFRTTTTQKLEGLQKENENLRAELIVLCRVVATLSSNHVESSKVKIPEPKAFSGVRSAKELDNFIWDMEQYFTTARVPDSYKLNITTMYLTSDAKLWWRTRNADDVSTGHPRIDT
ncbi:uncharacterized protein [Solanum lycopersicum]|uniref:uncharacterized protein n=1 Tax=Solanum lycopersicum TaxID=4081 RepID=UPI003749C8BC